MQSGSALLLFVAFWFVLACFIVLTYMPEFPR